MIVWKEYEDGKKKKVQAVRITEDSARELAEALPEGSLSADGKSLTWRSAYPSGVPYLVAAPTDGIWYVVCIDGRMVRMAQSVLADCFDLVEEQNRG